MKKLLLLLVLSFLSVNAQIMLPHMEKQTPEFKKYLIEHTIFTIWETTANCNGSFENPGDPGSESFFEFDGNGNLLKAVYRAPQMQVVSVDSFVYDDKFVLQSVISFDQVNEFAEGLPVTTFRTVSYDVQGRIHRISLHTMQGSKKEDQGYYEYVYSNTGDLEKVLDKTTLNIYGESMPATDYTYVNGKLVKEESAVRYAEHEYDAAGRLVQTIESLEGMDGSTTNYLYDKEGKLIEKIFTGLMVMGNSVYKYDFEGKLKTIEETFVYSPGSEPSLMLTQLFYNFQMED